MSIKMMTWAFHDSPADLSPAQVLVLLALADGADDTGLVRFMSEEDRSQEALALKTRMSLSTLKRAMTGLVERGLLERWRPTIFEGYEYRLLTTGQNDLSVAGQNDLSTTGQNDLSTSYPLVNVNARARAKGAKRQEVPLPADWKPTQAHVDLARERGLDLSNEAETFRAHAEAHDRRAKVWDAAFRQWLLRSRNVTASAQQTGWAPGDEWMGLAR